MVFFISGVSEIPPNEIPFSDFPRSRFFNSFFVGDSERMTKIIGVCLNKRGFEKNRHFGNKWNAIYLKKKLKLTRKNKTNLKPGSRSERGMGFEVPSFRKGQEPKDLEPEFFGFDRNGHVIKFGFFGKKYLLLKTNKKIN